MIIKTMAILGNIKKNWYLKLYFSLFGNKSILNSLNKYVSQNEF